MGRDNFMDSISLRQASRFSVSLSVLLIYEGLALAGGRP